MFETDQPLTIATCGCGSRARTYSSIATTLGNRYSVVAGADPIPERREAMRNISNNPDFRSFNSADELLAEDRLSDVIIIATQDGYHFEPAKKALEKGYHLLLEKPAAQTLDQTLELARLAKKYDRKILLCFVLRYTPFYSKVHEVISSGELGEIISIHANEGVEAWHQTHSFVRGHWGKTSECTPMIIAKCSHDTDYLAWLMGSRCKAVSSFGRLSHFTAENAPAGAIDRCVSGCPHAAPQGGNCMYDAHHYIGKHKRWLDMVYPHPTERSDEEVLEWLKTSQWGRCAWRCDNDAVDHQVVNMDFENGATASLTMTAFDLGRSIEVFGTKGVLRGGHSMKEATDVDITVRNHATGVTENIVLENDIADGYKGHGGGDYGLVNAMDTIFRGSGPDSTLIENSIEGVLIGFAAEESRVNGGQLIPITHRVEAPNPEPEPEPTLV
ncbi:Gfo/Idh/MocA family oxidoreductase [Verrucomicrobiaceae bacterium R5-34]|uniref:Gfo/Idh/MocA family oxidoreductase n=1 Tax=Oceaniferula flava TaxID=2800421 RepID=A0AAE2SCI8_9BACT|nr:Gfo/Idh/MocA family oxidoreductase [Oceaniferula flavus]MBK1830281.1 Gfo/Idh/MocA family oxidoreductase [Verrucomicrobiaceae bacterium R5-34]MBK1854872.1 Gfo/Idh/MocA family oxidoreductase [Oceaniferula flavus]MBM1136178.1 Gfo/Idh/MocA family oxidoreductase [Oceaniferula flavus]